MEQKQLRFYCQTGNLKQIREGLDRLSTEQKADTLRGLFQGPLRVEVIEYLGAELLRLPPKLVSPILIDLLYSEEAATRNLAVELLPELGKEAVESIVNHLNDLDSDVRLFAVQALSQVPLRQEVLRLLRDQLAVEKELNILAFIVETLGDLGMEEDADAIRELMVAYPHPYLQFVAQRSLLRLGVRMEVPKSL
jgi:hypothetical protein